MNIMNKKLKILHVVPTLKKDGAEVQLSTLFKNFQHTDIDLFTFDMYPNGDSVIDNLNQIKVMTSKSFFGFVYLNNLIRNNDYDFVHSHLPKSDIIVGIICKLNKVSNHIISVHAQYGTRKGENKIKYKLTEKIWKWVVNSSVGVIAISEKIKTWLISEKEISEEIISVIHYGVEIKNSISNNLKIHTLSVYLRPSNQTDYIDFILKLFPHRIIFNPGAENPELFDLFSSKGINCENSCTLVLLSTKQY